MSISMEDKYIELLLKKCIDVEKSKGLFVSYDVINQDFVDKIVERVRGLGVIKKTIRKNQTIY